MNYMSDFRNSGLKNDVMILVTIMISLTPVSNRVLPILTIVKYQLITTEHVSIIDNLKLNCF